MDVTTSRSDQRGRPAQLRWRAICLFAGWILANVSAIASADQTIRSVTVSPLEDLYIYPLKDAPARAISLNDAQVSAEIAAVITAIKVNVGDNVARGDVIAVLDCQEYDVSLEKAQAELEAAKAKLGFAKSQRDTANKLSVKKNIAKEEFDKRYSEFAVAEAEVERMEASLENAKRLVDDCQLRAPFSGVVVERIASIGDYAVTGTPIIRLLDDQNIEVSANIQEQDFSSLQEAQELTFFNRQDSFDVQVRTMLPNMDSKLRSFEVRLSFKNKLAPPGAAGRLQWRMKRPYLPSEYLVRRDKRLGVFILAEDTARFHALSGAQQGRPVEVALPGDTLVILDGRQSLLDGQAVRVVQPGS